MNKIKDVPFSDFVELVQFLKFNDEKCHKKLFFLVLCREGFLWNIIFLI